jgi:uncharacterized membrane protein
MANEGVPEERSSGGESQRDPGLTSLEQRVARLEVELAALRRQVTTKGEAEGAAVRSVPVAPPPPPIPTRPRSDAASSRRLVSEAWAEPGPQPPPPSSDSFEERLGSQIFNRIAIVLLLIGAAYFLKMAIDRQWIGPTGRVLAGLVAGTGLVLWSERFRHKGFAAFSYSLNAVGSGVLYLSLWAAFHLFHLLPADAALALMLLVTAWNAYMAWAHDSQLLAVYALVGGFATPVLLSTGGNHEVFLFIYLLAIDAATIALVRLKNWPRLLLWTFPLTLAFFIAWYAEYYAASELATTAVFIALFGAAFGSAPLGRKQAAGNREHGTGSGEQTTERVSRLGTLIEDILLPLANGAFVSLAFYFVLEESGHHALLPWLMVLLAAAYLALMQAPQTRTASAIHLSLAVVFLTIAVPLKASGHWITVGWLVEGLALLWVATRLAGSDAAEDGEESYSSGTLRWLGSAALTLGFCGVLTHEFDGLVGPVAQYFNGNTGTALTGVAIFAASAALSLRAGGTGGDHGWLRTAAVAFAAIDVTAILLTLREVLPVEMRGLHTPFQTADFAAALTGLAIFAGVIAVTLRLGRTHPDDEFWTNSAALSTIAFNLVAVLTGVREIVAMWTFSSDAAAGNVDAPLQQALAISAFLMLYGAALLAVGFWKRSAFLRWQALVLLIFSILKAFLYDMRSLSQGYRVASLLGLGALLMAISFAYQKDWLNMREAERKQGLDAEQKADAEGVR